MKTKTNRFLSIFMILTILASLLTSLTMTASAVEYLPGGQQLFENFESTGDYNSSAYQIGTASTRKATPSSASTYQSEEFAGLIVYQGNNTKTGTSYDYTTEGPNANLVIEYDIYFEDLTETGSTFRFRLRDLDEYQNTNPIDITFSANTITTSKASWDYQLQDDHWYHIRHIIKGTDSDIKPVRKHDLYIDGEAVITNGALGSSSYYKFPKLDTLFLSLIASESATETTAYLDNVSVYKANSTAPMPVNNGGLLTEIREAESILSSGNYSEATKTAAQEQIDAAKNVYTSSAATAEEIALAQTTLATYFENIVEDGGEIIYPGGVLVYESFEGIEPTGDSTTNTTTSQPVGTTATIYKKRKGTDSGAGLGDYARQSGYSNSSFIANFEDPSYFGAYVDDTTTIDEVAAQGSNAKLTLEFDHRMESLATDDQAADLRIMIGTEEMSGTMNSSGRAKSAASVFLKYPNEVSVYYSGSSANTYYLPDDMTIEQWHRYQLTLNLTDEDANGLSTFTFTVDGKNLVDGNGSSKQSYNTILSSGAIAKAQLISYYGDVNGVDNISIYKTTETYKSLSTAELMTKLHEVNAKMEAYQAAEGTEEWETFDKAVDDAGEMVTTAFGTYDENGTAVNPVKSQTDVTDALTALETAENDLIEVLSPYYVSGLITDETTGELTGVTVQEIKDSDATAKMIIATYDENGMVAAQIQAVTAGENTLTSSMDITGKTVKVFIWDMSESALLDYLADVYTIEAVTE